MQRCANTRTNVTGKVTKEAGEVLISNLVLGGKR